MKHIYQKLSKVYSSDYPAWATYMLFRSFQAILRDFVYAKMLHAPGLRIGCRSSIRGARNISFGKKVYAKSNFWIEAVVAYNGQVFTPRIEIGDEVSFSDGVHISCIENIKIGCHTLVGSHVYISDHNHGVYKSSVQSFPSLPPEMRILQGGPIVIGANVWIGDNAVIVGPITIGDGAIIGANSVVKSNVPAHTIVAGVPARSIKKFNDITQCWEKL